MTTKPVDTQIVSLYIQDHNTTGHRFVFTVEPPAFRAVNFRCIGTRSTKRGLTLHRVESLDDVSFLNKGEQMQVREAIRQVLEQRLGVRVRVPKGALDLTPRLEDQP